MINTFLTASIDNKYPEPFEDRIDILYRELELATKWQRPSVLLAIYSSEYVRADVDIALENRLHTLGQSAYHIKIKNQDDADVSLQISELGNLDNVVFFVEGLRWGASQDGSFAYCSLNNRREFFIDNQIRVVFWLTEKEAMDLAHYAPDYWVFRHRAIEFVDSPQPDQISPNLLESAWQGTGDLGISAEDLDAKIALRMALLTDLPMGNESTAARANLLLTLGVLHWRRGDYERATQILNTALDLSSRLEDNGFEALCFNAIALVQTALGRIEDAIQAYQNAIALAPEQKSPWNNLGILYRKLGRYTEAFTSFQKAVEQNASDALGWNGLGDVYLETGRNTDAVYAYLKAIELSPDYAHSWSGLGKSYMEEGQLDDSLAAHQKAIEIDRRTVDSWFGLGIIHRMKGNAEHASIAFQTALELDPKNALAWNELGNLYYNAGAFDKAMRSYQKSIESNQDCCLTYRNLASIYVHKGLLAEAIPHLLKGIKLSDNPKETAYLWSQLGEFYRKLEDNDNAIEAFHKADALDPQTAPHDTGSSTTNSDSANTPSEEDISSQSALQPEPELVRDEPETAESSVPVNVSKDEDPPVSDETDIITAEPHVEFVDWMDGLAAVQSILSISESTSANGSNSRIVENLDENELVPDLPSDPLDDYKNLEEASPSIESLPEIPELPGLSEQSIDDVISIPSDPGITSTDSEEAYPTLEGDNQHLPAQAETTFRSDSASQILMAEDKDTEMTHISIDQKNTQIWNELGNIYYNTGAFDEAMHAFEMAIELDPSYGWSYNNLASIYFHEKRYAEAVPLYIKGLQLLEDAKDRALLWNRLGDTYRRLDEHDEAAASYRKAMELDRNNVSLLTRARLSLLGNHRA
jgi:tetratricopeptide (TPR) repeat protein